MAGVSVERKFKIWIDPYETEITLSDLGLDSDATEEDIEEALWAEVHHHAKHNAPGGWEEVD